MGTSQQVCQKMGLTHLCIWVTTVVHQSEWSEDEPGFLLSQLAGSRFNDGRCRSKDGIPRHGAACLLDVAALSYVTASLEAKRHCILPIRDLADGHCTF
jgi:hypothetical protein